MAGQILNQIDLFYELDSDGCLRRPLQEKLADTLSVKDFGAVGDGATDDVAAFNAAIDWVNAHGNVSHLANRGIEIQVPNGTYNLKAGGLTAILVSSIGIRLSKGATLLLRDGPCFTLGSLSVFIENFHLVGGRHVVEIADTVDSTQALVWGVNAARIFISDLALYRVARIFGCDIAAGKTVTNAHIVHVYGLGLPDYNWVDIKNTAGGSGADIRLLESNVYPFAPPANPDILPKSVTAITKASPGAVTCTAHGFTTGDKVRLMGVGGMTQVNGNDYTITSTGPNTFTIGVDTTGFSTYTSGGAAVELHWTNGYTGAVLSIEGAWDTARVSGGIYQHYRYLCKLKSNGSGGAPISFVNISPNYWDYGGSSIVDIDLAGASITQLYIHECWHFSLEGPVIGLRSSGGGNVVGMVVSNFVVGLCGENFVTDTGGFLIDPIFENILVLAMNRVKYGSTTYGFLFQAATGNPAINGIRWIAPAETFGAGADTYLIPTVGFYAPNGANRITLRDCDFLDGGGGGFGITMGAAKHLLMGNRNLGGALPEYTAIITPTVGASPYSWQNRTGTPCLVKVANGTVSSATISQSGGTITVASATGFVTTVGRDQTLTLTYSSLPTVTVAPINL